ncbi:MAG: hypothetical protein COA33_003080 [Fluviicola sp.]|nr:hypothetical protein [Fluviicola sp.]
MLPQEIKNKRILISVLNWGIGHVSRSIGLIQQLIEQENTVVIACDEVQKDIFSQYFSEIQFIAHDGYPFLFKGRGNFATDLLKSSKNLSARMRKEQKEVEKYIIEHQIDLVLSDHRYGFISTVVDSVFITHQLNLPVKWYQFAAQKLHVNLLRKFSEIWILDFEDNRLAGKLSKNIKGLDCEYIGPYSRFMSCDSVEKTGGTIIVASGPLIYAQQFVNEQFLDEQSEKTKVIAPSGVSIPVGVERIASNWKTQDSELLKAKKIISRSGYSTIMDLHFLKCDSELTPTKGQLEQIYLSSLHKKRP